MSNIITLQNIHNSISEPRFQGFLSNSSEDVEKALELYIWNCRLCEALYTSLHVLEVTLRNKFHTKIQEKYGDKWYDKGILIDRDLARIQEVKKQLSDQKKPHNSGDIIASLNMGFWLGLLGGKYETKLWRPCLYYSFPNSGKPFKRKDAFNKLFSIKNLRNRIAHHEPIYNKPCDKVYKDLLEVMGWMCKDTETWLNKNSRFDEVYFQKPSFYEVIKK